MSASQILLAARGQEDRWLTENPNRTFFEAKYTPKVNRLRETLEVPFDSQGTTFGTTGQCTLPAKGDYLTHLTLRLILPPIYQVRQGAYVYPTPSSQVGAGVYVNMGLTYVNADGTTLTANTTGTHYFSVGASVTLSGTAYSIFDLDGTYTIASIPTSNSFTCLTTIAGLSQNKGTASTLGLIPSDVVGYFSTSNFDLWAYNLTNKSWGVTNAVFNGAETELTVTTSVSANFSIGQDVHVIIESLSIDGIYTVIGSTDTTFTIGSVTPYRGVAVGIDATMVSNDGKTWSPPNAVNGEWYSVGFGNGTFVVAGIRQIKYSTDGQNWYTTVPPFESVGYSVAYGNGTFICIADTPAVSNDNGKTWSLPTYIFGEWYGIAYGNGIFVAVGYNQTMYSTDDGQTWSYPPLYTPGLWTSVEYNGTDTFVAVGFDQTMFSTDDGQSWSLALFTPGQWTSVAYNGTDTFVAVGFDYTMFSTDDGQSWSLPLLIPGIWESVAYVNGVFVAVGFDYTMYSTTNGASWSTPLYTPGSWKGVIVGTYVYTQNQADLVYLETPALVVDTTPTQFTFSSNVYTSISFATPQDAAFWGFDSRNGLTYSFPITVPWSYIQSGWIPGFLPPSLSSWDDSVAHKICKAVRIMLGKQTIKEYSGEYIELQNDLTLSYENKAILKLMNGTLDQTQAIVAREYYTTLPIGTKEIPLCALTQQQISVEIDFEKYANLSPHLNPGTGDFLDPDSYVTYNASTGILNGQPINVQTTLSYQQYILILTYDGNIILYDTTKQIVDANSYTVITSLGEITGIFSQFCILGGTLYIQLTNGYLLRGSVNEFIKGNISSFIPSNNYLPGPIDDIGPPTGTMIADARYVYYAQSDLAQTHVFLTRYDTQSSFWTSTGYTSFDFTSNIDSSVTSIYQMISTGNQIIALTNTPGKFYIYNLNANFTVAWNAIEYSSFGSQITSGVIIEKTLYFVADGYKIITYTNDSFEKYILYPQFVSSGTLLTYSTDGKDWNNSDTVGAGYAVAYGNGVVVAVGDHLVTRSTNGQTWSTPETNSGVWRSVAYGNGVFVAVGINVTMYSSDDGQTWSTPASSSDSWSSVAYGDGVFVAVGESQTMYSIDNGQSWSTPLATPGARWWGVAYGNGTFVTVGSEVPYIIYSNDKGQSWDVSIGVPVNAWLGVGYGNGVFVVVGDSLTMSSFDDGQTWPTITAVSIGYGNDVAYGNGVFVLTSTKGNASSTDNGGSWVMSIERNDSQSITFVETSDVVPYIGTTLQNLLAVGTTIYASSNSSSISSVIQIDTTQDLASPFAYKYYSTTTSYAPQVFDGSAPKIFANGPRFVYMFTNDPSGETTPTNVIRFDPYPPVSILKASILVDYESLPPNIQKPDKALIGLVQTQQVTDMNYMNIRGPVKELWVTGASATTNVFEYSDLAKLSTLTLAGEQIVTDDDGTHMFLNVIEPFETHTSMPIRNVSVVSFEFDPESALPNGTINFSRIRDQIFNGNAETVWARTYNILSIQGGVGGLMFN